MNGKQVFGRALHVDFDAGGKAKGSYKQQEESDRNRLYNKDDIRER
jgi:hypothetical protein